MENQTEKLIIIGSGPAGLTAAIYAARGHLNPLVIAGREAGGQLVLTTDVDDFPGFEMGIQGPELMAKMRLQAERFKARFVSEDVISVDLKSRPLTVKTETQSFQAESLIIATGASATWLGLPSEQRLRGRGVSACAVCDGPFFKDKQVIVVGGGDTAMREAQHLSKFCTKVTLIHRRDQLRAQAALVELVKSKPNVEFLFNRMVDEVLGEDKVRGVRLKDTQTGEVEELEVEGVFVAIGHQPNTAFLKGQIELDEKGYVKVYSEAGGGSGTRGAFGTNGACGTKTSVEGVFVAGDVADFRYRQAVTAAGAGCQAALDVEEYLEHLKLPTNGGQ